MSGIGTASAQAAALRKAAEDCVKAAQDFKYFVNESESVLSRFEKALRAFSRQKFSDERDVLESLDNKDYIVQFLMDCVRNRSISWRIVSDCKTMLTSSSSKWTKAFNNYSGPPVDLERRPGPPPKIEPPTPKAPIPFCVELLALMAFAFPLLAILLPCDCYLRFYLFLLGLMMLVPFLTLELLWLCGCGWLIHRFSVGVYAPKLNARAMGFMWWPSTTIFEKPAAWAEDMDGEEDGGCISFGQWWCNAARSDASVENEDSLSWSHVFSCRSCPCRADADSDSDGSDTEGGRRRSVAVKSASSASSAAGEDSRMLAKVTISNGERTPQLAELYGDGSLVGLPGWAESDGSSIFFDSAGRSGEEYWAKQDCFRLDFCRKSWCCVATFGLLMAFIAAALPPGISGQCGAVKLPLEVYFVLDASASIDEQTWEDEKAATEAIYTEFASTYMPSTGQVHVGVGQFSSQANHIIDTSNDLDAVTQDLRSMTQNSGATSFTEALKLCSTKLEAFQPSTGGDTFQVCVLITDGQDTDNTPAYELHDLIPGINLMGIYVGSAQSQRDTMQLISCYEKSSDCPWFVDATNFQDLKDRSAQVADQVTSQIQTTGECKRPLWTMGFLPLLLPFLIWWIYLRVHCTRKPDQTSWKHTDPQRLHVAGQNEMTKFAATK